MTRIIIFLFSWLLLIPPEKITRKELIFSTDADLKEVFYVLKSNPEIRHGYYKMTYKKQVLVEGHYSDGLKDSLWSLYDFNGRLKVTGKYLLDRRVGNWKFFDKSEKLEQEIDYTNQEVVFYKTKFSNHPFKIIDGTDTLVSVLERPPLYVGGSSGLEEMISSEIMIPLHKPNDKVEGTVFVEFIIDTEGKLSHYRVLKGISACCNIEALRVVKAIRGEWLPGILNGNHVSVYYTIPVIFDNKQHQAGLADIMN